MGRPSITFRVPGKVRSSKNRRILLGLWDKVRKKCQCRSVHSKEAKQDLERIAQHARAAMAEQGWAFCEDDELDLSYDYDVPRDQTIITVTVLGPRPKGTTGRKQDAFAALETIADALQNVLYRNDSQIREGRYKRWPEGIQEPTVRFYND